MSENTVNVIDGAAFLVSDTRGDARAGEASRETDGLFYRDVRHLSEFVLAVRDVPFRLLSTDDTAYYAAAFFFALDTGSAGRPYRHAEVSLIRKRNLLGVLREEITLHNHSHRPVPVELELRFAADFADLFEVKDDRIEKKGRLERSRGPDSILFSYTREDFARRTAVSFRVPEATDLRLECPEDPAEPARATAAFGLPARSGWTMALDVVPYEGSGEPDPSLRRQDFSHARSRLREDFERWKEESPQLLSGSDDLKRGWEQSIADLAALRYHDEGGRGEEVIAAGLPWFMALFGRDSLIAGYQTVMLKPDLSKGVLRALARRQARGFDDFTDAEPGKILHELRHGEMTHAGESPHRPYYGTADATPLFLVLLHETWRWTADAGLVCDLEGPARGALAWISEHGDSDGDGYVDYVKRSEAGLDNQGWKDSHNSVLFADGSPAEGPVALCEVQGYVYDAWLRTAELAERVWDDADLAAELRRKAGHLKRRFDEDFWMDDRGYYALALDGEGRGVDSITSNAGHLLWSGIVPERRTGKLVRNLMDPEVLFSGWGVRTMSKGDGGYNPIEYHNGTVWPHDSSLIAHGLYRYGYQTEAARIASALIDAAAYFDYRLPEVFAGYDREETDFPVEYPSASSPQAWASGTIPLLVRTTLGVRPDPEKGVLETGLLLPREFADLRIEDVPAFGKKFDVPARAD